MSGSTGGEQGNEVALRDVVAGDLAVFFEQQRDPAANYMAAFTPKDPEDWDAFLSHWTQLLGDETIASQSVLFNEQVAGHVVRFEQFGQPAVSYWIGKEFWGQDVATRALSQFLDYLDERPLYARVAKDNIASIRVLEKCGFTVIGEDKGFANARGVEVEELIFKLGQT